LVRAFDAVRDRGDASLAAQLSAITDKVNSQLAAGPNPQAEQAILASLERDVTVTWSTLVRDARGDVAGLCDDIESMTGLSVSPGLNAGGKLAAFDSFRTGVKPDGKTPRLSGLEVLGRIGEALSWFDPTGVLFFVSLIVAKYGASSAKAKLLREEFEGSIRDLLDRAGLELRNRLAELIDSAEESVTASYERLIRDRDRSVSAAAEALHAGRGEPGGMAGARESLSGLTELRDRAAALAGQLTALHSSSVVT